MDIKLEEQKKKVELQKQKLQIREKLLREKERQRKSKRMSDLVEMVFKTELEKLDDQALLGAMLEIREKISDENLKQWKMRGEAHQKDEPRGVLLAISLKNNPNAEIRSLFKKMKFRWNPFRREFCGFANESEIKLLLKDIDYTMEMVPWQE